jgi:hypothetical protein
MKQTAVEWLVEELTKQNMFMHLFAKEIEQAKEMEKQQIIDACNQEECFGSSGYGIHEDITKGEEYYNVTFKNK